MKHNKFIIIIILLFSFSNYANAQKIKKYLYPLKNGLIQFKCEVGGSNYSGDLAQGKINTDYYSFFVIRPNIKAGLSTYISNYWVLSSNIFYINVKGADDPAHRWSNGRGTNYNRGVSFSTHMAGFESLLSFPVFPKRTLKRYGFEPKIGLAIINFTPTTILDNKRYNLRDVGTFGQNFDQNIKNYSKFTFAIPMGFTLIYDVSHKTHITFSYHAYKLFTDYIDDFGNDKFITADYIEANNITVDDYFMDIANPNNQSGFRSHTDRSDFVSTFSIGMNFQIARNWNYRKWNNRILP